MSERPATVLQYDARSAECLIFTYKEGLLSPVAHDLCVRVARLTIDVDEGAPEVAARFDARSLRVVSAMREGKEAHGLLSPAELNKIEQHIMDDVLEAERHPEIRFASSSVVADGDGFQINGALFLHGHQRTIAFPVRREAGRYRAELRLHQPDFGIRPFTAMLGTLRIKPDVLVRISIPL